MRVRDRRVRAQRGEVRAHARARRRERASAGSWSTTGQPATAATWAMPWPIRPAPTTAIRSMAGSLTDAAPGWDGSRYGAPMPRIAFIGAGSTVFTRNLVGDILGFAELADIDEIALMDIDAERLATSELVARAPGRGARRRRARRGDARPPARRSTAPTTSSHDPGRRLRAVHRHRLRGARSVRPAPDDRRHARHRRDHARPAHDPGAARHVRRHGGALPRRARSSTTSTRWRSTAGRSPRASDDPHGRAVPLRAGHGVRARRTTSASRPTRSTTPRPASTTWRSTCASSATARTSTPRCGSSPSRPRARLATACATRCCATSATSSPSRASTSPSTCRGSSSATAPDLIERFNIPLDEYPRRCDEPDRRVGRAASGGSSAGGERRGRAQRRVRRRHHPRIETGEPSRFYGNVPNPRAARSTTCRPAAASRCRASSTRTASSRSPSARCRRSSRR